MGVCSVYHRGEPVITCPVRFREDWLIVNDASEFFFESGTKWTSLGEVRLKNKAGGPIGNIDYVLVSYDDRGRVLEFASLEVQADYLVTGDPDLFILQTVNTTQIVTMAEFLAMLS
ncbi:MAG: hypothetical protein LH606_08450 [Cytophagaceae bacterium]|nr:hypothetical protein [Cytophagaceae bacterium]